MNLIENWKNFIGNIKDLGYKEIEAYKYLIMVFIVFDLFGVYWYLGAKKIGIAFLLVAIAALVFLLVVGGDKAPPKKQIPKTEKEVKEKMEEESVSEDQQEESTEEDTGFDFGLPSAEEFNKRLDKALGTGF